MTREDLSIYKNYSLEYGIQKSTVHKICADLGFAPNLWVKHLTPDQKAKYYKKCREYFHGPKLKALTKDRITELIQKGCVRGLRLKKRLPVRGQRTRSNAKTIKRWKL